MADFTALDPRHVAREANPAAVAHACGLSLVDGVALCPFHADTHPSLGWFSGRDGKARWSCHGCGWRGDCVDLLRECLSLTGAQAVERCAGLSGTAQHAPRARPVESARWARLISDAHVRLDIGRLAPLCPPRAAPWVGETFWLGHDRRGHLLMPHCSAAGEVLGVKSRDPGGAKRAWPGSALTTLYGRWSYGPELPGTVVICEGESDTWAARWILSRLPDTAVLGAPRGAASGTTAEWRAEVAGRAVVLVFDGDTQGRTGVSQWAEELRSSALSVAVVTLPDGADVRSSPPSDVYHRVSYARK